MLGISVNTTALDALCAALGGIFMLVSLSYPPLFLLALAIGGGRIAVRVYGVRTRWALDGAALLAALCLIQTGVLLLAVPGVGGLILWRLMAHFEGGDEARLVRLGATGSQQVLRDAKRALRQRQQQRGTFKARWADSADLALGNMVIEPNERFGRNVALGNMAGKHGHLVGVKEGHAGRRELGHFLVTGATRAGKGRMLTANAVMWPESLVVLDIKGENYKLTAGLRAAHSRVLALHPNGKGHRYDPFAAMRGSNEGLKTAANIIIDPGQDKQPVFGQTAENALYAAFLGARLEDAPTLPYVQALLDEGVMGFVQHLAGLNDRTINRALTQFLSVKPSEFTLESFQSSSSGLLRGAWGVLNTRCSTFMTDGVMAMMSGSDFKAENLYDENTSLYLIFPESEAAATGKAFQIVMISLVNSLISAYDKRDAEDDKPERQILWLLDEAGRTPIPHLDDYIATVAGRGMIFGLYVQDLPQLYTNYEVAERTVRSNIRTQVFHTPTEETTAKYVEARLGQQTIVHERHDHSPGLGETIFSDMFNLPLEPEIVRESHRPLMTTDELYQMPLDHIIIFAAATPPIYTWRIEPFQIFNDLDQAPKAPPLAQLEPVEYTLQPPTLAAPEPAVTELELDEPPPPAKEERDSPADPEF